MTAVADKLREARALIAKGWTQGTFRASRPSESVCYCLYGAINKAVLGYADADCSATFEYEEFLGKAIGREPLDLANWNDDPERTQAEVLAAFDKAIELAEGARD
jgi:hypothetical protein